MGAGRASRAAAEPPAPREIVLDRDDIDVTESVVVKPGTYRVRDLNGDGILRVKADGVTVTLTGVTLDGAPEGATPDTFEGVGVSVVGHAKCQVRGGALRGFRVGLRGERAQAIEIHQVDVSGNRTMHLKSTPAREDESDWLWPHENDKAEWETRYGAGISLTGCADARVSSCKARGTQNGLLLTRCDGASAFRNDFSFLSGWGIALYRSSRCHIERNHVDFCVRGYSHGVYARGQDSAGILVFEQCSDGWFVANSATHSGDGFFLYAGNETLRRTGQGGCNGNSVYANDFSQAVANGIEATFSERNGFADNLLEECDHGIWAGYSHRSLITGNSIARCANAVSIEHGRQNDIEDNAVKECGVGIHLWWDDDKDLLESPYGKAQDTSSSMNVVKGNWVTGGGTGLLLDGDLDSQVVGNRIIDGAVGLSVRGATRLGTFKGNVVRTALSVDARGTVPLRLGANRFARWTVHESETVSKECDLTEEPEIPALHEWHPSSSKPGRQDFPKLPPDMPRGREFMVIGEWGPLDPRLPALVPFARSGSAAATMRVIGAGLPFRITSMTDGFVAEPTEGKGPAVVRVKAKPGAATASVASWEIGVRIGEKDFTAKGTLLSSPWKVRWWAWTKDPREDAAAWKALLATPPLDERTVDSLDFSWGAGKPSEKVPADHFGTVAETKVDLPAGTWLLSTTSDDGIRVFVDGKPVIDDWTWHAPKENSATLDLSAGPHSIRVEHFELDGWAALGCAIEAAARPR